MLIILLYLLHKRTCNIISTAGCWLTPCCDPRKDLFKQFGIDLSFVATRSGLTRWEEHKEKDEFADEDEDAYDPDNPKDP